MLLSTLRAQIADHLNQAKAAKVKLELVSVFLPCYFSLNKSVLELLILASDA